MFVEQYIYLILLGGAGTFVIYMIWLVAVSRRSWRWYDDPLLCSNCAYNLTGNKSGVCPECGTAL